MDTNETEIKKAPETWAIAELMGHMTLAGRATRPGEYGGLWQIDIPDETSTGGFRTEFFSSASVYRIRIVSEAVACAYATRNQVYEYDAPIITREEHLEIVDRARQEIQRQRDEIEVLRRRLTAVNALPAGEFPELDELQELNESDAMGNFNSQEQL